MNSAPELVELVELVVVQQFILKQQQHRLHLKLVHCDIGFESCPSGYRLMGVNILDGIVNYLACPECSGVETLE